MNAVTVLDESLRVTIHLRDQSTKQLSEDVCSGSGDNVDLKSLSQSLLSLQTKVNTFLTELVDQERETTQPANETNNTRKSDEDEDDDEDNDDDKKEEPPVKQQKR